MSRLTSFLNFGEIHSSAPLSLRLCFLPKVFSFIPSSRQTVVVAFLLFLPNLHNLLGRLHLSLGLHHLSR